MGHRSFKYLDNEETKNPGTHIVQGEEEGLIPQAMDEIPKTREPLVMRKVLLKQVKEVDEPPQRKAFFKTMCKVQGKCYKVIIDCGSNDNLVSIEVIEKLKLPKTKHPIPYKVSWLQNGHQLLVSEQCEIDLEIGITKIEYSVM